MLELYFESKKRSGGGLIQSIEIAEDHAVIEFENESGKKFNVFSVWNR